MIHSFDTDDAAKYGVTGAVIIYHIRYWIAKNMASGKHQHDGRTWTYNSANGFTMLFPYLSAPQIKRELKKLVDAGALLKGDYNKNRYDRTAWYAVTDESKLPISPIDGTKSSRHRDGKVSPIPDNYTNNNINSMSGRPDNTVAKTLLDYLNSSAGRNYRAVDSNIRLINARLKEFSADDIAAVIDDRVKAWGGDEKMCDYLRPATLFNATKFAQYHGSLGSKRKTKERKVVV